MVRRACCVSNWASLLADKAEVDFDSDMPEPAATPLANDRQSQCPRDEAGRAAASAPRVARRPRRARSTSPMAPPPMARATPATGRWPMIVQAAVSRAVRPRAEAPSSIVRPAAPRLQCGWTGGSSSKDLAESRVPPPATATAWRGPRSTAVQIATRAAARSKPRSGGDDRPPRRFRIAPGRRQCRPSAPSTTPRAVLTGRRTR